MRKTAITIASVAVAALTAILINPAAAVAAAPGSSGGGSSLDARAAAGVKEDGIGTQASWYSGTVSAGGTQGWVWNNAPVNLAYQVGFQPLGASTTATCQFQVTRNWYVQQFTGSEREFHFTIRNVGSIACATNILLVWHAAGASWSTGGLNPGATQGWVWNNNPANLDYIVGLSPTGSTNTANCQFEVTRNWYVKQASGEREFHFVVKNVGTIACVADIRLAWVTASNIGSTGWLAVGASTALQWNNANPLNRVYTLGFNPIGGGCALEATSQWYGQRINADGSIEREFYYIIRNVGSIACSGSVLLGGADA